MERTAELVLPVLKEGGCLLEWQMKDDIIGKEERENLQEWGEFLFFSGPGSTRQSIIDHKTIVNISGIVLFCVIIKIICGCWLCSDIISILEGNRNISLNIKQHIIVALRNVLQ